MSGIRVIIAIVTAYAPATDVAIIIAGFINAVATPPAITPAIPPIASVCMSVPKYCTAITITNAKQIPATQIFSIENPSSASNKPPPTGNRACHKSDDTTSGEILVIVGNNIVVKLNPRINHIIKKAIF